MSIPGEDSPVSHDNPILSAQKIGDLVRERRLANHLTQRELSELAGVGLRLVSELERGKATLRMDVVNRVLTVFGLMLGTVPAVREATQLDATP
jgi:y4mF family transcriptional regulator